MAVHVYQFGDVDVSLEAVGDVGDADSGHSVVRQVQFVQTAVVLRTVSRRI